MGQITLRILDQDYLVRTVPASARLKVRAPGGQEFFFDPAREEFWDDSGRQPFRPEAAGLDRASLAAQLRLLDAQRRGAIPQSSLAPTMAGKRATLYDNGDFRYFVYLDPVPSPVGGFALTITSQWNSSAKPEEEQFRFRACLERQGLEQLQALIQQELA